MQLLDIAKLPTAENSAIQLHPSDDVAIARVPLTPGTELYIAGHTIRVIDPIPAGHKLAIAVIAMSLLVSPIWFLMARLMHKLILSHAKVLGFDLAGLRLWSPAPGRRGVNPSPALAPDRPGLDEL